MKTHYQSPARSDRTLCGYSWGQYTYRSSIPLLHTVKVEEVTCVKCLLIIRADIDQTIKANT